MSVRSRILQLEAGGGDVEDAVPTLPPRPRQNDIPSLDPDAIATDTTTGPDRPRRPPVPPKAKSLSSHKATAPSRSIASKTNSITLVDLEETGEHDQSPLIQLEPVPEPLDPQSNKPGYAEPIVGRPGSAHDHHTKPRRSPSPLAGVTDGIAKLRVGAPKLFKPVSDSAVATLKTVQTDVPRAFQDLPRNTQQAFMKVQTEAPKAFQSALKGTQKVATDVQAGIKRTVSGIPVPKAFAQTGEDISDLTKLSLGRPGVCSRCATLKLDTLFSDSQGSDHITWASPLSRVALHAKWCEMCRLLVLVLSRQQHDPMTNAEVREHMPQDWLRGVPFSTWVSEGYIHQDGNWPFGRSEHRYEGSTQILGTIGESLWDISKRSSGVATKVLIRSALGQQRALIQTKDFQKSQSRMYKEGYQRGIEESTRYPVSATIMITVSTTKAESPGLMYVDLVGCSNKPGAEMQVLSHFMLRAVRNGFHISPQPHQTMSYGQVLDKDWINVAMAKLWLAKCEAQHGTACSEHGWSIAMEKPGFLRLIDVSELCIVIAEKPQSARYIALSYVWGGADMFKLRYSNVQSLSQPGGLQRHLVRIPRTVVDAIEVVKAVGERYLWVDALCIIQEKSSESREQIANMDAVYGSALFTIVAAQGLTADAGLPGVRRDYLSAGHDGLPRHVAQPLAKLKDDFSIIAPFHSTVKEVDTSRTWDSRAWTFQERLLSRRLLIFADDEVIWHCRNMIEREDMPVNQSGYGVEPLDWLALKPQYLGVGVDSHWKDGSFEVTRHGTTHLVRSGTYAEYCRMVAQYSQRNMTYESDAVDALAGLLRIFSLCFESECIYGLPASLLDLALLWRPVERLNRRDKDLGFPSWSWAGWKGRVAYDQPVKTKRDQSGQLIDIDGVRPLLRYFIFSEVTGNLQPLHGTSRGIPLTSDELPVGWEATASWTGRHALLNNRRDPHISELDARVVPELTRMHLIFWTSYCTAFRLARLSGGIMAAGDQPTIVDSDFNPVGRALLDSPSNNMFEHHLEMIMLAEAHSALLVPSAKDDEFSCYQLMLIETDSRTNIAYRIGLGWISKAAWQVVEPQQRLICLG